MANGSVQACSAGCTAICDELAQVQMFQEEGAIAEAMYEPFGERDVPGFDEVTDPDELAALDLTVEDLNPSDSEFRAGVFRRTGTDDYIVGFKGTTFSSRQDWMNNLSQGATSRSDYYRRAQGIGRDAASNIGRGEVGSVKYVGHSLGGGLASMAAHTSGQPATTFNSAGLHGFNRSWFNAPPVDAVRVDGEILTTAQRWGGILAPDAVGTPYRLRPPPSVASVGERADVSGWDWVVPGRPAYRYGRAAIERSVELHGMGPVNESLDLRAQELQQQAAAGGCQC